MKKKKALLLAACAVLLVVASVMGTMAYLTSKTETITNTFSIGKVNITMDEAQVNLDGQPVKADGSLPDAEKGEVANRIDRGTNSYRLMPGHTYTKDPTVHVTGGSENSWLFVKVEGALTAFESKAEGYKSISAQMTTNGWTQLTDASGNAIAGVFYQEYTSQATQKDVKVFESFTIDANADDVEGWNSITAENTKITVTAYAIQKDGFTTAADAWTEVSK